MPTPPVGLIVTRISMTQAPDKNLLPESIIVAIVIETPKIRSNEEINYRSAGDKFLDLYF